MLQPLALTGTYPRVIGILYFQFRRKKNWSDFKYPEEAFHGFLFLAWINNINIKVSDWGN